MFFKNDVANKVPLLTLLDVTFRRFRRRSRGYIQWILLHPICHVVGLILFVTWFVFLATHPAVTSHPKMKDIKDTLHQHLEHVDPDNNIPLIGPTNPTTSAGITELPGQNHLPVNDVLPATDAMGQHEPTKAQADPIVTTPQLTHAPTQAPTPTPKRNEVISHSGYIQNERKKIKKNDPQAQEKADAVKEAFTHAWNGYVTHAWGHDELRPVSKSHVDWLALGLTIIDSLDTLLIMGLDDEFERAREWVYTSANFDRSVEVSVFETNIRVVGGFLTAYEQTGDRLFLEKAQDVADRLCNAFNTPTGIPHAAVNLKTGVSHNAKWTGGGSILSEVGTMQLEFRQLSKHTGNPKYQDMVDKISHHLSSILPADGLAPLYVNPSSGQWSSKQISFGALGDSYYEYLIKMWFQTGKSEAWIHETYERTMDGMIDILIQESTPSGFTYVAERANNRLVHKMDHLACFVGGMLVLGAADSPRKAEHMRAAGGIAETCWQMYARSPSGLSPENVNFRPNKDMEAGTMYYIQRPEAVEAWFYMWRATHDQKWRDHAWEMFQSIQKHCRTDVGFSGLRSVASASPVKDDQQQSFFLAETLKYLYLIFLPDDVFDLNTYVYNTEAHPLRIWTKM
eukprot:Rmarinus@m.3840